MKNVLLLLAIGLTACGGKLSDEQRKQLHEGMEQQKIIQMTDAEIVTAAREQGQAIYSDLEKIKSDPKKIDSLANHYRVKIKWSVPGASNAREVEQQLIEAYVVGMATGSLQDNIQPLHQSASELTYDSLLFSKPIVTPMADGVEKLDGIWNIYLSKKQVVLKAASGK